MKQADIPGERRPLDVAVDSTLVAEARALDVDLPGIVESALRREIASERARRWREENAEAIARNNARIERDGLWCDDYRLF